MDTLLARFPAELPARHRPALRYVIDPSRFAVRGAVPAVLEGAIEDRFEEEGITVVRASPHDAATTAGVNAVPVYVLGVGGAAFVPTGRVTVRFQEGVGARSRADALRDLGYHVADVPPYAPNMAWLEPISGDVAAAIAGLDRLAALPDVEHVEPQLLTAGERR